MSVGIYSPCWSYCKSWVVQGMVLLILRPEEFGFLRYLKQAKVSLNECLNFSWAKIADIQAQVLSHTIFFSMVVSMNFLSTFFLI